MNFEQQGYREIKPKHVKLSASQIQKPEANGSLAKASVSLPSVMMLLYNEDLMKVICQK